MYLPYSAIKKGYTGNFGTNDALCIYYKLKSWEKRGVFLSVFKGKVDGHLLVTKKSTNTN